MSACECSAYVGFEVEEGTRLDQEGRHALGVEGGGQVQRRLAVLW